MENSKRETERELFGPSYRKPRFYKLEAIVTPKMLLATVGLILIFAGVMLLLQAVMETE